MNVCFLTQGALFGSGGTLVWPAGELWGPGTHFRPVVEARQPTTLHWRRFEEALNTLGLRDYFSVFVVSAQAGARKPEARIYQHAVSGLDLPPERTVYIDTSPGYVKGAAALGMNAVVLARSGRPPAEDLLWVSSLGEVEKIVG